MTKEAIRFVLITALVLGVVFGLHLSVLVLADYSLFDNSIVLAYVSNYVLACIVFVFLLFLNAKFKNTLGFIFIGGSLLKFVLYIAVFAPLYKKDGDVTSLEFLTFFVPYIACLVYETLCVIRLLNKPQ